MRRSPVVAVALVVALGAANAAYAACYPPNKGAHGYYLVPTTGVRIQVDLFNRHPAADSAIAHPVQITSATSTDFIGWGTYRSKVVVGSCPAYDGTAWRVYIDGRSYNTYFCWATFGTVAAGAANQVFQLRYENCPVTPYSGRWVAFLNGTFKDCERINGTTADGVFAGGEWISPGPAQDIDVHYEQAKYALGSNWIGWGSLAKCEDPPCRIRKISNTDFWAELP